MGFLRSTFSLISRIGLSTCINVFGYYLPAISSVRAVLHKDEYEYHQWTTYFLILYLFTLIEPFIDLAFNPWLKVFFLLWLSLPQYQGASVIYAKLLEPCLDRYEDDMDNKLEKMQKEGKRQILTFMANTGYSMMYKAWDLLTLAREGRLFEDAVKKDQKKDNEMTKQNSPGKRNPREIVTRLSSSFSHSGTEGVDNDKYVSDFLCLLEKGLFLFASVKTKSDDDDDDDLSHCHPPLSGGINLRVFSYEEDVNAFAISEVDGSDDDIFLLPTQQIESVEEVDAHGIVIRLDTGDEAELVLSGAEDRETLLGGLTVSLPHLNAAIMDDDDE